jgi:hypothetical protein
MPAGNKTEKDPVPSGDRTARRHIEKLLDEALAETFPASDPVAVTPPAPDHDKTAGKGRRKAR